MTKVDDSHFEYTFDNTDVLPDHIEYKYTRGGWTEDELDTFGSKKVSQEAISKTVEDNFDLSPNGIIKKLNLKKPIY